MLGFGFAFDQLRSNDVPHGVCHKDGRGHDGFFSGSSNIAGSKCNDQTNHRTEEASEGVPGDGGSWVVSPLRLPDHGTAGNNGETACNQHGNACVGNNGGDITTKRDEDDTDTSNGELKQDGVESIVSERGDD